MLNEPIGNHALEIFLCGQILPWAPPSMSNNGSLISSYLSGGYKFALVLRCVGLVYVNICLEEAFWYSGVDNARHLRGREQCFRSQFQFSAKLHVTDFCVLCNFYNFNTVSHTDLRIKWQTPSSMLFKFMLHFCVTVFMKCCSQPL